MLTGMMSKKEMLEEIQREKLDAVLNWEESSEPEEFLDSQLDCLVLWQRLILEGVTG